MTPPTAFSGAILAGGASRRMGRDKAFVDLGDRKLVEVAAQALAGAGATEVFAVGGDTEALARVGLKCVPDQFPGEGPLGGVITALQAATENVVAVLGCDHGATNQEAVTLLLQALGTADVVIPTTQDHWQTAHAVWRTSCAGSLRAAFDNGIRSIRDATEDLAVQLVEPAQARWFDDIDTPADLEAHTALACDHMPSQSEQQ